jgi:Ethanolamine utilization protein EutJ (predicted chaperonin)
MCLKIDYCNKKFDWKKQIELEIYNRNGQHQKYIYEIYEMLKPVLNGKDDLIWKYIDWKKLEKIKKGK